MAAANGLIDAAEATAQPLCALVRAARLRLSLSATPILTVRWEAMRRGLVIAQDSGNRTIETHLAIILAAWKPNTATRWPRSNTSAWPSATTTTRVTRHIPCRPGCPRRYFSTGSDTTRRRPPSPVSPSSPITAVAIPEIGTAITHLRDVLGDQTYESLARKGETMTTAEMATYAYDQIDQARAELNAVSK